MWFVVMGHGIEMIKLICVMIFTDIQINFIDFCQISLIIFRARFMLIISLSDCCLCLLLQLVVSVYLPHKLMICTLWPTD